jgi:hypothetical protein
MSKIGIAKETSDGSLYCKECGEECEWSECNDCCGDGGFDGYEEDPNWYQPGEIVPCRMCNGKGGNYWCENPACQTGLILQINKK